MTEQLTQNPVAEAAPAAPQHARLTASRGLPDWLAKENIALAISNYQHGCLFFIGRGPDGKLRSHERKIERCQGIWADGQSLWVSNRHLLWRFENVVPANHMTKEGFTHKYVPFEARVTGAIDCHDIAMAEVDGLLQPIFINTAFNCLATISQSRSFKPLWRPKFISKIAAGDRCHLNGLAMEGHRAAYVTAVGTSDTVDSWRDQRWDGGVLMDVASHEIVAQGLSMPHSPRLYRGKLWLLNSGTGEFGTIDLQSGQFTAVCTCPGFARGLDFSGDYAVIGLSMPRNGKAFTGLPLDDALLARGHEARCGLMVVNLRSGRTEYIVNFAEPITELYDVKVLPNVRGAEAIGFLNDDIKNYITIETGPGS